MNALRKHKFIAWLLSLSIGLFPLKGITEDIDIFVGASAGSAANPNVLIVFDNTSNWSRNNQHFPGVDTVGGMEVAAVKSAIADLDDSINVGVMEYVTASGNYNQGGFIRYAVRPMSSANKTSLNTLLDFMGTNVTDPAEKLNSNVPYGGLMYDIYNYFGGNNAWASNAAVPSSLADAAGYETSFTKFKSPLSCDQNCAKNFVILISNPDSNGPSADSGTDLSGTSNTTYLTAAGGSSSQLQLYTDYTYTPTTQTTSLGTSSQCYASQAACNTALTSPSNADNISSLCGNDGTDAYDSTEIYNAGCACSASVANATVSCGGSDLVYTMKATTPATSTAIGTTTRCYSDSSGSPSGYPHAQEGTQCSAGQTTSFSNKTVTCSGANKYTYTVSCATASATTTIGNSLSCHASAADCVNNELTPTYSGSYPSGTTFSCEAPTVSTYTTCAATGGLRYSLTGSLTTYGNPQPTGAKSTDSNPWNADEWSRMLYQEGIDVGDCDKLKVRTYTIDTFYAQPDDRYTGLLNSMAWSGGGKYFAATSSSELANALKQIFQEIQSVNSTFASASLPINATNRSQNENQVFIGMFRPDPDAKPRWFGNVKRYQLISDSAGNLQLGDKDGKTAINLNTGFITECATSYWTSDSPNAPGKTDNSGYWSAYPINPTPSGNCTTSSYSEFSDSPDGPRVEKGAVAEVIRKGNAPVGTDATPTWQETRTIWTSNGTSVLSFDTTNTGLSSTLVNWVRGQDTEDENSNGALGSQTPTVYTKETRASLHGDVVHSRPLPINYSSKVVVYYGSNDGTLRAVDANNGEELWSFIPPEFYSVLDRLRTQSPLVCYPNSPTYNAGTGTCTGAPAPTKRNYSFDGSIGVYQTASNDKVWIFPTMRRGGRTLYALDVTSASASGAQPVIKWKFGCPNLTDDSGCSSGASGIGQTWSIPNVAFIKGYSTSTPVAVFGGGYDSCEDSNTSSPSCGSAKGKAVYVLDTSTGAVIKEFTTSRSVASDVALIDMNFDNMPDFGYVGDTGGNLYRLNFSSYDSATNTYTPRAAGSWTITRIAYSSGLGHKFMFSPALFGGSGKIFVALGSGDREHPLADHYPFSSSVKNYFYTYRDCLPDPIPSSDSLTGGDSLNDTAKMNMSSATASPSCDATKTLASNCADNKGWALQLNNGTGEQTVTSALISGGMVTFSTNRPLPPDDGSCATSLGEARGYWLDLYNGSGAIGVDGSCGGVASAAFVGGGLPPSPVAGTVTIDGKPTSVVIGAIQKSGGASSPISPQKAAATNLPARKRVYSIIKGEN